LRCEHIDHALTAYHVDAIASLIDKRVIRISARVNAGQPAAIGCLKYCEFCRTAEDGEDALTGWLLEREWVIRAELIGWPAGDLSIGRAIDDCDLVCVWDVDEDALAAAVEPEALRVRSKRNVGDLLTSHGVDDGNASTAIAYKDPLRGIIDADIVSVVAERDLSDGHQVSTPIDLHQAALTVRDEYAICGRNVADTLWFLEARQGPDRLAFFQVNDRDAVIAEFGNIESLALDIDSEVIDPAADVAQGDPGFDHEQLRIDGLSEVFSRSGERHESACERGQQSAH
jgi:hypothetical protein